MTEQLLTLAEVAARLRLHPETFRRRRRALAAAGFPAPWDDPLDRRRLLWRAGEVDAWIAGRSGRAAAAAPVAAEPADTLTAAELAAARATMRDRARRIAPRLAHIGDRR